MPANSMANESPRTQNRNEPGHRALRKGRVALSAHVYLVTTTTRARDPIFLDFSAACAASRCFENTRILGDAKMLAWVLMPDHVHWLIQLGEKDSLSTVVNRLKSASAREANQSLHRSGALWAQAFHDHGLRNEDDLRDSARYIIANPIRAGLAKRVGDYPFWNAIWI